MYGRAQIISMSSAIVGTQNASLSNDYVYADTRKTIHVTVNGIWQEERAGQGRIGEDMTGWDEIQLSANLLYLPLNHDKSCSRSKSRPLLVGHFSNRAYLKFMAFPAAPISFLISRVLDSQLVIQLDAAVSCEWGLISCHTRCGNQLW